MMDKSKSLTAAYFSLGAFALVSQTMILREFFVVVYGNEFIFGVLLANWLIGIFTGALLGSAAADRDKNNLRTFSISLLLLSVLFPLCITAIRFLYTISGTPVGTYVSFSNVVLYSALFIIPISFFIGFAFPVAARIHTGCSAAGAVNEAVSQERVQKISSIYIVEALGSLLSGVIYTFFLVGRVNSYFIAGLITLPLLVSCWLTINNHRLKIMRFICVFLLILNLLALTPFINRKIENFTVEKRWRSFSDLPLNYALDSKYQDIAVSCLSNQYNLYLNTMLAAVFPNEDDNMVLAAHLAVQHPPLPVHQKMRILVIGDAVSGLAGRLLRFDVEKLVSVEIDPKVVETILTFIPPGEKQLIQKYQRDGRFEIKIRDGRKYVKDLLAGREPGIQSPCFDIVYVNVPEPSTLLLNRFYTVEFFSDIARILRKNGVVALKATASEDYTQGIVSDYTASIYNTVKSVFPYVTAAPGTQSFIFAALEPGVVSDNPAILEERYTQTGVSPNNLGLIFHSLYPPGKTAAVNNALRSHTRYRLNTDENPTAGFYFNKIIGWYGKSRVSHVLEFFEKVKTGDIIIIALVLFCSRLAFIAVKRKSTDMERGRSLKFHTLVAVFSGGMAGLSLEMVIIYTYQYNFGSVYHIIGFIIAIFMFGLPMGALAANALMRREKWRGEREVIKIIILIQGVIAAIAFLLPYMVTLFMRYSLLNQLVIFAETIIIGFVVGFLFPFAVRLYLGGSEKTGRAAGLIDAVDHMGAALGAFFVGSLFLPVMGVETVCHLLALFPLLSLLLLTTDRRALFTNTSKKRAKKTRI
ncbi:MAG: Polyamine aminopropyltransferase [Acidobacteriota bacterium]|nr:Polyamine aminopropyltransferase [Acidobacteriota bacterium]